MSGFGICCFDCGLVVLKISKEKKKKKKKGNRKEEGKKRNRQRREEKKRNHKGRNTFKQKNQTHICLLFFLIFILFFVLRNEASPRH
jgi:hypothetical protein